MDAIIILVRHGETQWNRELVFRGRKDIPLNERGLLQAQAIGEALRSKKIDAIYSSPLARAIETARPLSESLKIEIKLHKGLVDANFGKWEGKAVSQVEKEYPELFKIWKEKPWEIEFPAGESYKEIADRSYKALLDIAQAHKDQTVAIFTHRFILKVLVCEAIGLKKGFWNIFLSTGSISELWYEDKKFVLAKLNDTSHLESSTLGKQIDF